MVSSEGWNSFGTVSRILCTCLVTSLIFLHFDNCATIFTDLNGEIRIRLRQLINSCVRFIYNLWRDDHVSHLYETPDWLRWPKSLSHLHSTLQHTLFWFSFLPCYWFPFCLSKACQAILDLADPLTHKPLAFPVLGYVVCTPLLLSAFLTHLRLYLTLFFYCLYIFVILALYFYFFLFLVIILFYSVVITYHFLLCH